MKAMERITDRTQFTEVYHLLMDCADIWSRISANVPKALLPIQQAIHGELGEASCLVFKASNATDPKSKLSLLIPAQSTVFFLYNRLEYLVRAHGITVGQANEFIIVLRECHAQLGKWMNSINKEERHVS